MPYTPPPVTPGYKPPPLTPGYTPPPLVPTAQAPIASRRFNSNVPGPLTLPQRVSGSFQLPAKTQKGQSGTTNRPNGSSGVGANPYAPGSKATTFTPQTPQQIVAQLNTLLKTLGASGAHVPAALSL